VTTATVPFEVFRCDRRAMTLSRPGCARLWESAQRDRPQEHEGRFSCLTCPVGASHAGKTISTVAASVEALRRVCPRCRRQTSRLIHGRLCVGCYNRDREAVAGKNAKGGRPQLCDRLHVERLAVIDSAAPRIVQQDRVVDLVELIIVHARAATGALAFGRSGAVAW
jgi:hypothetical protein